MSTEELLSEFNLIYNNLASNQAPGLDRYEVSVYLTKGQELVEDALYSEFEHSEEARRKLAPVVDTAKLSKIAIASNSIIYPQYTTTFKLPENIRYIVNEQVKMSSEAGECAKGQFVKVQPISHDEIDATVRNPYKFNIRRALRLDTSSDGQPYVEILTKDSHIEYYQIRYVRTPEPIMVYDTTNFPEYANDKINGYSPLSTPRPVTLPESTHRKIIEIAAKLAYQDYKQ